MIANQSLHSLPLATALLIALSLGNQPAHASELLMAVIADHTSAALAADDKATGIDSASVQRGPSLGARNDFAGYFDSDNWSISPSFPGTADGSFLSIRVTLEPLYEVVPQQLLMAWQDAGSEESARRLQLRWSLDDFASILFTDHSIETWPAVDFNHIALPVVAPQAGSIEFRLYGYGAVSNIGVLGLTNTNLIDINGNAAALALYGEISAIPEPANISVVLALVAAIICYSRIRKRDCL